MRSIPKYIQKEGISSTETNLDRMGNQNEKPLQNRSDQLTKPLQD
jgi:hypothetical protein